MAVDYGIYKDKFLFPKSKIITGEQVIDSFLISLQITQIVFKKEQTKRKTVVPFQPLKKPQEEILD